MSNRILLVRARTPAEIDAGKQPLPLGILNDSSRDGWRFLPFTTTHGPSRRGWPTWEAAIPRWTGGLSRTESRAMLPGEGVSETLKRF